MSSIVKDIMIRSTANDVHTRRIFKDKFGDQIEIFRVRPSESTRPTRWSARARAARSDGSRVKPRGFTKPEPERRSETAARALLTPVSDPTPTTKKVRVCI